MMAASTLQANAKEYLSRIGRDLMQLIISHLPVPVDGRSVLPLARSCDNAANELILVELKRGRLEIAHYRQIRRYLERAHESPLLGAYLEGGAKLRGILATVEPFDFKPKHADVSILIVEAAQVIDFLKKRRRQLLRPANQTKRARKPRGATS